MTERSKNERARECTTSEYPKDESTNKEARAPHSTEGDSSESPKIEAKRERERERRAIQSEASKQD